MFSGQQIAGSFGSVTRHTRGPIGFSGLGGSSLDDPPTDGSLDVITIGSAPINTTELKNKIDNSDGFIVVDNASPEAVLAKKHTWTFSMERSANGQWIVRNSDYSSYLLYGSLAIGAVVLLKVFKK